MASTGGKTVATGYYDPEIKMWNCSNSKSHKSSVTCARLDRSGLFVLSGSTDLKAVITSTYIEEVDGKSSKENLPFEKVKINNKIYIIF